MTESVFRGRSLLSTRDYTKDELMYLIGFAEHLKDLKKRGVEHRYLAGKNIALLFEKTSTRTRAAFTTACIDLGAHPEYLGKNDIQLGKKETVRDTALVLGSMFDGIEFRGFKQEHVEDLAKYSGVPVWNGLTDKEHPTQMLADLLTLEEKFGCLKGLRFTYMGDARNNMGNSLMVACAKMGIHFTACAPKELFPAQELVAEARRIAEENECTIRLTEDVDQGVKDADAVYTDIWVSMGEPDSVWGTRIELLRRYQVNGEVMKKAKHTAVFMHCLPSFHDTRTTIGAEIAEKFGITEMEVTDEVFESRQSVVFDQAENRMHTIKAVIYATLC